MEPYKILDWDSSFFGFTVAKILPPRIRNQELIEILESMKKKGVTLVYWASDPDDEESQACARARNAFLADRKVTFVISSQEIQSLANSLSKSDLLAEEYLDSVSTSELEELALQAGVFSRFRIDTRIPQNKFAELYTIWIRRSVTKEIADTIFVVRNEGKIAGMVTVGEKNGRADIGLIAVDTSLRGHNAGKTLVQAAQNWGIAMGFSSAQVITQGDNLPACRFYEKCGYCVEKVENIYHFWINT
ncbi:MAG: GNAT family N-acetyltransferase [Geobacteraceae bacterium]|nr:GNAT family N-acetyltransferase [Geobacteraceae bacterium]NTW80070.1 GNAT family N-acetyltransferase [Geobacteraceae bacterium]